MNTLLLLSTVFMGLFGSLTCAPALAQAPAPVPTYHAFCRTIWTFESPCSTVSTTMVKQIEAFNPLSGCADCQYMLVSATTLSIKANHTSVDNLQTESLTFIFSPNILTTGCRVSALSSSLGFSTLLDGGLNYCNLYKLLSASGLDKTPGFMEMTDEWACLGYGLNTCKV